MTNVSVYLNILYINYIFRRLIFMNEGILIAYDDTYYSIGDTLVIQKRLTDILKQCGMRYFTGRSLYKPRKIPHDLCIGNDHRKRCPQIVRYICDQFPPQGLIFAKFFRRCIERVGQFRHLTVIFPLKTHIKISLGKCFRRLIDPDQ